MAHHRSSIHISVLIAGVGSLGLAVGISIGTPAAAADSGNPAVTCHPESVNGVEQDVCVGNPGVAAGIHPRDLYPGVYPWFGIGLGVGS
jgi:hypothetical protein